MTVLEAFEFVYYSLRNDSNAYKAMHIIANAYDEMKSALDNSKELMAVFDKIKKDEL